MSMTIPKSPLGLCFMRGQSIRSVGDRLHCASTQIESGKIQDARLTLGLARMSLETLTLISAKTDAKKAEALRKRLIKASDVVRSRKASSKEKLLALKSLSGDFQKLEARLSRSCRYYA